MTRVLGNKDNFRLDITDSRNMGQQEGSASSPDGRMRGFLFLV